MRLINADDVKELLLGLESLPWEEEVDDLVGTIPTAYDVEKTVKEFKDLKEINQYHFECEKTFENLTDAEFHRGCVEAFDEAIKITEDSCSSTDIYGAGYKLGYEDGYNIAIDDFVNKLSKYLDMENATKYGNKNAEQARNSYSTLMKYEIADAIDDVTEQLKEGGV